MSRRPDVKTACDAALTYRYDGSFEGFLCCVFESYTAHEMPTAIIGPNVSEGSLFDVKEISTDEEHAARVARSIPARISPAADDLLRHAFLTCLPEKELVMLRFLRQGYRYGARFLSFAGNEEVWRLTEAVKRLLHEAHLLTGFIRFSDQKGILVTTIVGIPLGITHYSGILSAPPSIAPIVWQFEWHNILTVDMIVVVLTFLFIDMFDTIGTLIGVSNRAGMVDENGNVKNLNQAFMADAIGTTVGAMLGTSTVTTYVESASGVNAGGRSGLTSFTSALCFLVALLFAPLFLAIPGQATAAALVLVGVMMMHDVRKVDFSDYVTGVPCFICIVLMPLTYSISDGILIGVISYVLIHLLSGTLKDKDARNNMNWATILLAVLFICRYAFL